MKGRSMKGSWWRRWRRRRSQRIEIELGENFDEKGLFHIVYPGEVFEASSGNVAIQIWPTGEGKIRIDALIDRPASWSGWRC